MKTLLMTGVAVLAVAGCSGLNAAKAPADDVNAAHVGAVERAAREGGVDVLWVNTPRKPTGDEDANDRAAKGGQR